MEVAFLSVHINFKFKPLLFQDVVVVLELLILLHLLLNFLLISISFVLKLLLHLVAVLLKHSQFGIKTLHFELQLITFMFFQNEYGLLLSNLLFSILDLLLQLRNQVFIIAVKKVAVVGLCEKAAFFLHLLLGESCLWFGLYEIELFVWTCFLLVFH